MGLVEEKLHVAHAAASLVRDGMVVGLGTGSTVAQLLVVLATRAPQARYVATSPAADRFVVIVDCSKAVSTLYPPVPVELSSFALAATLEHLGTVRVRDPAPSPDGGVLADYTGIVADPASLARRLWATPGVLAHGLFAPELLSEVLVAVGESVQRRERRGAP